MLPPLLHLLTARPQLVVDHAEAYADLLGYEVAQVSLHWKRRLLLAAVALCSAAVAVVLAGVAAMLAAVVPLEQMPAAWVLLAAPLAPALVAAGCGWALNAQRDARVFEHIKSQLKADLSMLREASATP